MKRFCSFIFGILLAFQTLSLRAQDSIPNPSPETSRASQGMMFLTRLRLADPDYRVVLMACLKDNSLNLLLSRFVKPEEIPILVQGLLEQLRKSFPREDLNVIAFRPVVPLKEAGRARLVGTTGEVTYSPAETRP